MKHRVPQFREAAERHEWACVISGGQGPLQHGVTENYRFLQRLSPSQRGMFAAKSGWGSRPEGILVPKQVR